MDNAATAAPLKDLFEKDIYSSQKSILFTVFTPSKRASNSSQRLSKRHLKNQNGFPKHNIDFETKMQVIFTPQILQSALDIIWIFCDSRAVNLQKSALKKK
jgi:transposase-like protein